MKLTMYPIMYVVDMNTCIYYTNVYLSETDTYIYRNVIPNDLISQMNYSYLTYIDI